MKINKKYFIIFILLVYFLIVFDLYCNKVHALESYKTVYMPDANISGTYTWSSYQNILELNTKKRPFANEGKGTIIFTFTMSGEVAINSIELYTTNAAGWTCELGTNTYYNDNAKQLHTHTAKCPVNNIGPNGIVKVKLDGYAWNLAGSITFGEFWTIVKDEPGQSYEQNIADVYNVINNSATQDRQIAEQAHQDSQAIQDKMDQDIDESDKEAPNQDEYNEAKEQEENIIDSINEVSPNDITFGQDIQATNKIWELTTKILQTNAKVMGLVISVLSIGIIKLIMNR